MTEDNKLPLNPQESTPSGDATEKKGTRRGNTKKREDATTNMVRQQQQQQQQTAATVSMNITEERKVEEQAPQQQHQQHQQQGQCDDQEEEEWTPIAVHVIDNESRCVECVEHLRKFSHIGFDCEGYPELSRHSKIGLIQLATEYDIFLFDLIAFKHVIPVCLRDLLQSKGIV